MGKDAQGMENKHFNYTYMFIQYLAMFKQTQDRQSRCESKQVAQMSAKMNKVK